LDLGAGEVADVAAVDCLPDLVDDQHDLQTLILELLFLQEGSEFLFDL